MKFSIFTYIAYVFFSISAANAQSTYDTLNFLNNFNSTNCIGKGGSWQGMSCSNSNNSKDEAVLNKHRVHTPNGTIVDLPNQLINADSKEKKEIENFADILKN